MQFIDFIRFLRSTMSTVTPWHTWNSIYSLLLTRLQQKQLLSSGEGLVHCFSRLNNIIPLQIQWNLRILIGELCAPDFVVFAGSRERKSSHARLHVPPNDWRLLGINRAFQPEFDAEVAAVCREAYGAAFIYLNIYSLQSFWTWGSSPLELRWNST